MSLKRKMRFYRKLSIVVLFSMVFQIVTPTISWALTGGPSQPEYSSFEPVVTNNMVDQFTGDFTYNLPVLNIPGANGGGYALSLSYHSGVNPEQEASWVGHGWTLNPGAINRSKQGFPDDWENETVKYWNKSKPNLTIASGVKGGVEFFSTDALGKVTESTGVGLNGSLGISYNNYKGWGYLGSVGLSLGGGVVNLGYNISDGEGSFSVNVSPFTQASSDKSKTRTDKKIASEEQKNKDAGKSDSKKLLKLYNKKNNLNRAKSYLGKGAASFGLFTKPTSYSASNSSEFFGLNANLSFAGAVTPTGAPIGGELGFFVRIASQWTNNENYEKVNGYMYPPATDNPTNIMDYHTERLAGDYKMQDRYLGIPFNNADDFMVTGEGISGGFRLYHNETGDFRPNTESSKIVSVEYEGEIDFGVNNGGGAAIGGGIQNFKIGPWGTPRAFSSESRNNRFFRFNSDLGGNVLLANLDNNLAGISSSVPLSENGKISRLIQPNYSSGRNGASSFIGYNTNTEMLENKSGVHYKSYSKDLATEKHLTRADDKQLGEFSITNDAGMNYTYALPVYSKYEKDLNINVSKDDVPYNTRDLAHKNAFKSSHVLDGKLKVIQGEERNAKYATSHLLTCITTPDYIDRTNNGPSDDDFGGYTHFVYNKHSSNYRWRSPYTGFKYNPGLLYTSNDDLGFASMGEKELYYLDYIETKTHVALFVKSYRTDGLGAALNHEADRSKTAKGTQRLQKLDKIELFHKSELDYDSSTKIYTRKTDAKPLKVVNFQYDYSLVGNVENNNGYGVDKFGNAVSVSDIKNVNVKKGKLTLKKMWFDYEGTYDAKISPYEFQYHYPNVNEYPPKYQQGGDDPILQPTNSIENPNYKVSAVDPWGIYRSEGELRENNMTSWVDQTKDESDFDPAAWQLKAIKLPSGGEIHVQYEQDDYSYVQDKTALVMANLTGNSADDGYTQIGKIDVDIWNDDMTNTTSSKVKRNHIFFIDESSIGLNPDQMIPGDKSHLTGLRDEIRKLYLSNTEKIYWKFLYSLEGDDASKIGECDGEFIKGYANVSEVGIASVNGNNRVYVKLGKDSETDEDVPVKVCRDFRQANTLPIRKDCNPVTQFEGAAGEEDEGKLFSIAKEFVGALVQPHVDLVDRNCKVLNVNHSYLRIPIVKHKRAKKGGGLRVKRLLMFDDGSSTDDGSSELYGTEYIYKKRTADGHVISSGVATNEPGSIREENALVSFLPKNGISIRGKIRELFAGRDKDQYEGPLGESLLPSASVGYSNVITRNIHSGQTNTGFSVFEFYTIKDAPFKAEATELSPKKNTEEFYLPIYTGIVNVVTRKMKAAQGYLFKKYSFHGKMKSTKTYSASSYDVENMLSPDSRALVSGQVYEYFGMKSNGVINHNEMNLPVMTNLHTIGTKALGVEMDVSTETRQIDEDYYHGNLSFDVTVGFFGFTVVPFAAVFPTITTMTGELKTHVTSKVIKYPAVVKRTISYQDGIWHGTENLAFNEHSGQPLITRTWDSYDKVDVNFGGTDEIHSGAYTQYNVPAYWEYANMDQKAKGEGYIIETDSDLIINDQSGQREITLEFPDGYDSDNVFSEGDLISLGIDESNNGSSKLLFHVSNVFIACDGILKTILTLKPVYFNGTLYSSDDYFKISIKNLEIIRSGRNNTANSNIASFTTYGNVGESNCTNCPAQTKTAWSETQSNSYSQIVTTPEIEPTDVKFNIRYRDGNNSEFVGFYISQNYPSSRISNSKISPDGNYFSFGCNIDSYLNKWTFVSTDIELVNGNMTAYNGGYDNNNTASYLDSEDDKILFTTFASFEENFTNSSSVYHELSAPSNKWHGFNKILSITPRVNKNGVNGNNELEGILVFDFLVEYKTYKVGILPLVRLGTTTYTFTYETDLKLCTNLSETSETFTRDYSCTTTNYDYTVNNVVSASVSTLDDDWWFNKGAYDVLLPDGSSDGHNKYELGQKGKWRTKSTYAYRVDQEKSMSQAFDPSNIETNPNQSNINAGTFTMDLYNWKDPNKNDENDWLRMNTVTKYSPNGNALEEENVIGIKSAAKFGYHKSVPYLVAQNASNGTVIFESFENEYSTGVFEDNVTNVSSQNGGIISNSTSHSGQNSLKVSPGQYAVGTSVERNNQVKKNGFQLKLWAKSSTAINLYVVYGQGIDVNFKPVARSGEWLLYEALITPDMIYHSGATERFHIESRGNSDVFIDDFRMQPMDSEMVTYVYDTKTLRLLASFDDQHFGLFYQYDSEGKLVRKLIETEKGVKTLSETQYNTKVQNKND